MNEVNEEVFDSVWGEIAYSGTEFFGADDSHIGSDGVDEWKLVGFEFEDYERISVESTVATYIFSYSIEISGVSYEHWEPYDYSGESIISSGRRHDCSGSAEVLVTRIVDPEFDWKSDFEYENAKIQRAAITEDAYEDDDDDFEDVECCARCGKKIGYVWEVCHWDGKGNPICDDCVAQDGQSFVCAQCGKIYSEEMRGNNGTYCKECEDTYELD